MNNILYSESIIKEHNRCEMVKCNSFATSKLKIKVDNIGTISLFLCNECKIKFIELGDSKIE